MVRNKYFDGGDFESVQQRMEKMLENIFDEMRPTGSPRKRCGNLRLTFMRQLRKLLSWLRLPA